MSITQADSIFLDTTCKNYFITERKTMDDVETLDVDTIKVLSFKKNTSSAKATLHISGIVQPAAALVKTNPWRYTSNMKWEFEKKDNSWIGKPIEGWMRND